MPEEVTGPLGTGSVYDFSGQIAEPPKVSNFATLTKNIREAGEKLDDTTEFAARAGQDIRRFQSETAAQLDFIVDDPDFSLNQISGYGGELQRLRSRQAQTLQDVYATSAGLVEARERKRMLAEEREYQAQLLKDSTKLQLSLQAAGMGIRGAATMSRKELINAIAKLNFQKKASSGISTGGGGFWDTGGVGVSTIDWGGAGTQPMEFNQAPPPAQIGTEPTSFFG